MSGVDQIELTEQRWVFDVAFLHALRRELGFRNAEYFTAQPGNIRGHYVFREATEPFGQLGPLQPVLASFTLQLFVIPIQALQVLVQPGDILVQSRDVVIQPGHEGGEFGLQGINTFVDHWHDDTVIERPKFAKGFKGQCIHKSSLIAAGVAQSLDIFKILVGGERAVIPPG